MFRVTPISSVAQPLHAAASLKTCVVIWIQNYISTIMSITYYRKYKAFRPYSFHSLQLCLTEVFIYIILHFILVQVGMYLFSIELYHVHRCQ
jgi:hypothetical protein